MHKPIPSTYINLEYKTAMNDVNAIRKRLLKYVGPCLLLAVLFNIPKFFEAKVVYKTDDMEPSLVNNQTIVYISRQILKITACTLVQDV